MEPRLIKERVLEYLDSGKYVRVYDSSPVRMFVYTKTNSDVTATYTVITLPYEEAVSPIGIDSLLLLLNTFGKRHIESLYPSIQIKGAEASGLRNTMDFLNAVGTYVYVEGESAFTPKTELYLYD